MGVQRPLGELEAVFGSGAPGGINPVRIAGVRRPLLAPGPAEFLN
jgi:hypothetical protein